MRDVPANHEAALDGLAWDGVELGLGWVWCRGSWVDDWVERVSGWVGRWVGK